MIDALLALISSLVSACKFPADLALENLALRQQLALYKRRHPRPQLHPQDRLFWVWLSKVWGQWQAALLIVKPETVLSWHRESTGRPPVNAQLRALIRQMAKANPLWGAPRIHGELLKLGIDVSERTVSRLKPKDSKPPSQTWRTLLDNHF